MIVLRRAFAAGIAFLVVFYCYYVLSVIFPHTPHMPSANVTFISIKGLLNISVRGPIVEYTYGYPYGFPKDNICRALDVTIGKNFHEYPLAECDWGVRYNPPLNTIDRPTPKP